MFGSKATQAASVFCTDEIIINAPPERVAQFINTAARILDYYPSGFHRRQLSFTQSACFGVIGASLLEIDEQCEGFIRLTAYNALPIFRRKHINTVTADAIKAGSFFTMVEDWQLASVADNPQQTRLLKTWHSFKQPRLTFIPAGLIRSFVRAIARFERIKIKRYWRTDS